MPRDLDYGAPLTTRRKRLLRLRQIVADENNRINLDEFRHDYRGCCVGGLAYNDAVFRAEGLNLAAGVRDWQHHAAKFFDISLAYGTFGSKQTGDWVPHREEALERIDRLLALDAKGTLLPYKTTQNPLDMWRDLAIARFQ